MEKFENNMFQAKKETKIELRDLADIEIPKEAQSILEALQKAGFEAYAVGGCVRDILRGAKPKDWDITTNAKPEELRRVFPKSFYENKFFTVTARTGSKDPTLAEIEITTYRSETKYTDKRHPDEVTAANTLEEDLARRDFTVNAMALTLPTADSRQPTAKKLIDPFDGQKDLERGLIRAVGVPSERFQEDALRLIRAVRFATTLGFEIEPKTLEAITDNSGLLEFVSKERIRDEFLKIIASENAGKGVDVARETRLLQYIIPELLEGYGMKQNKHHIYEVYEHNLRSLDAAAKQKFGADVRLAALLHDVGKPRTKEGEGPDAHFYNHQMVSAQMAVEILSRLRFPRKQIEKIALLARYHMFNSDPEEITDSSVRRLIRSVGLENMPELHQVRIADRVGSGVKKAEPYRLRKFMYLVEKVSRDPISAKMLKVNGDDIMGILGIQPSPKIGQILDVLLGEVLDDPKKNKKAYLAKKIKELGKLEETELQTIAQKARAEREKIEEKEDEMTKEKYWVT